MDHADGLAPANVEKVTPAFGQWQPIETAPKSESYSEIIVAYEVGNVAVAYWNDFEGRGYWQRAHAGFEPLDATHWMPLPKAPDSDDRTVIPPSA